ncbi:MAG: hypothetical protein KDB01_13025, partial [Planctomycetaceae bacterium]|nr:hypothetical protein [Planctomycetaceae bacterium]
MAAVFDLPSWERILNDFNYSREKITPMLEALWDGRFDEARTLFGQMSGVSEAAATGTVRDLFHGITKLELAHVANELGVAIGNNASAEEIQGLLDKTRALTVAYKLALGNGDAEYDYVWRSTRGSDEMLFGPKFDALDDIKDAIAARDHVDRHADGSDGSRGPRTFTVGPGSGYVLFDPEIAPGAIFWLGQRYTHIDLQDQKVAVDRLPSLQRAGDFSGREVSGREVQRMALKRSRPPTKKTLKSPAKMQGNQGFMSGETGIRT